MTAGVSGQHVSGDAASFRDAARGKITAVVKVLPAGCPAGMGPPLALRLGNRDGLGVGYFGGTAWPAAGLPAGQAIREILAGQAPGPAALRRGRWELAPFSGPDCASSCCRVGWHPRVQSGGSFCDRTAGRCPGGHEPAIDD